LEPGRFQDVGKPTGVIASQLRFLDLLDPGRWNNEKMCVSLEAVLADAPEPVTCFFRIPAAGKNRFDVTAKIIREHADHHELWRKPPAILDQRVIVLLG